MENNTKKEAAGKPIITTIVFGIVLLILGITLYYAIKLYYFGTLGHSVFAIIPLFGWFIFATIATILVLLKTWKLIQSNNTTVLITIFAILIGILYISPILFIILGLDEVVRCIFRPYYCNLW